MRKKSEIVSDWFETIDGEDDAFLDFADGLHINEFTIEDGERVIWLEDGNYYIAHAERIGENDGEKEKAIIEELIGYGVEFEK